MRRARGVCGLTIAAFALVACSDKSTNETDSTDRNSVATTVDVEATDPAAVEESTTTTVADIIEIAHDPASGDFVGALDDVTDQTCEHEADGWRVAGSATNPSSDTVDYRIYISLLNGESTTRALVESELLAVAPGASATFDELIDLPDDDLRCVLRVERRVAGS